MRATNGRREGGRMEEGREEKRERGRERGTEGERGSSEEGRERDSGLGGGGRGDISWEDPTLNHMWTCIRNSGVVPVTLCAALKCTGSTMCVQVVRVRSDSVINETMRLQW